MSVYYDVFTYVIEPNLKIWPEEIVMLPIPSFSVIKYHQFYRKIATFDGI